MDDFQARIEALTQIFGARARAHDETDRFVAENFQELRERKILSAGVPEALGGGGVSHREICEALRVLARGCSSTALALAMHAQLVAHQVWNERHGIRGRRLLQAVAANELFLVSTGANDWLASSGRLVRADGGYRFSARKAFVSGCPAGSLLLTSGPFDDPDGGPQVLHFAVPFSAEGVRIEEDWQALGMRGTGSHTVVLDDVFVPAADVHLKRPRGRFSPAFSVIVAVAVPCVVAVYVGIAEAAAAIARQRAMTNKDDPVLPLLIGEMENQLVTAQIALESMLDLANDYDFEPIVENANAALIRKTIAIQATVSVVVKAVEATGGSAYFRSNGLERLLRDIHAGQFHPLPEKRQQMFSGRLALGLDPIPDLA